MDFVKTKLLDAGYPVCDNFLTDSCTDYDLIKYHEFTLKKMPDILINMHLQNIGYIVKGGKAIDAYLPEKEKLGSDDYDIIVQDINHVIDMTRVFFDEMTQFFKGSICFQVIELGLGEEIPVIQIGVLSKERCSMFPIDIIYDTKPRYNKEIIDGIPYLSLSEIYTDIKLTFRDRKRIYESKVAAVYDKEVDEEQYREKIKDIIIEIKEALKRASDGKKPFFKNDLYDNNIGEYLDEALEDLVAPLSNLEERCDALSAAKKQKDKLDQTEKRLEVVKNLQSVKLRIPPNDQKEMF